MPSPLSYCQRLISYMTTYELKAICIAASLEIKKRKHRTKPRAYHMLGICRYGPDCTYIHVAPNNEIHNAELPSKSEEIMEISIAPAIEPTKPNMVDVDGLDDGLFHQPRIHKDLPCRSLKTRYHESLAKNKAQRMAPAPKLRIPWPQISYKVDQELSPQKLQQISEEIIAKINSNHPCKTDSLKQR